MDRFTTQGWFDYELLDCGGEQKLERFGEIVLIRPEASAPWPPKFSTAYWRRIAHAQFKSGNHSGGQWQRFKPVPAKWPIKWESKEITITLQLQLTRFKHIGVFPEQSTNWHCLRQFLQQLKRPGRVLNLFAYTGAASVVCKACAADVVHVDSVKQVIGWARQNMESSGLHDIRWVHEDALKFCEKELKRGRKYDVIIMDPPAYGIGARGERWRLEDQLGKLTETALGLCAQDEHLLILNTYTPSIDPESLRQLFVSKTADQVKIECASLGIRNQSNQKIDLGATIRLRKY